MPSQFRRLRAVQPAALLLGAALLVASPFAAAMAQSDSKMSSHAMKAEQHEETIEQRIDTLHTELKITADEQPEWDAVAKTMRDNAAAMEKLAAEKAAQSDKGMTAIQDLQTYAEFAQAHVDHLKQLTSAFESLYDKMPQAQKKIADEVFERSRKQNDSSQG
jgi:transcriptional regulator